MALTTVMRKMRVYQDAYSFDHSNTSTEHSCTTSSQDMQKTASEGQTFRAWVSARVIHHIQKQMPEAILAALFVKGTADGHDLLRCRSHTSC